MTEFYTGKGMLVFDANDPIAVRSVLPHAKMLDYKGRPHVAVKHDLDAVTILRNIGIEAPSPVNHGWAYPGRYKPWEHQRATVEFLTVNRRAFVLNGLGCVDADTEYLTPTGWVRIADYAGGVVGQFDPQTDAVTFVAPEQYIKLPCPEMIHLKTDYGVDQMLSPEHRVLVYDTNLPERFEVLSAEALDARLGGAPLEYPRRWAWAKGKQISRRSLGFKTTFRPPAREGLPLSEAELRLQVAVCADGYFAKFGDKCIIRVKKERKKIRLRGLLAAAETPYTEVSNDYPTAVGFTVFRFHAPLRTKTFKEWAWESSAAQLAVVADEFVHWDGSVRKKEGRSFSSYDKASSDFIQYACAASGFTSLLSAQVRERRGVVETEWRVSVRPRSDIIGVLHTGVKGVRTSNTARVVPADGMKYCFTVPTGFLLLRRNGCIFATGNSGKSSSALWAAEYLKVNGMIDRVVIVCPKSCTHKVWEDEIFSTLMHRTTVVVEGSRERKLDMAASDSDFLIVNHDGLATISHVIAKDSRISLIIYDESAVLRNGNTRRYKTLKALLKPTMRLWLMTATPCPSAPTDAWAPARLVRPETVPPYFNAFKRQTMIQVSTFKWIPKPEASQLAFAALQPAIRFRTEDCIDLPPVTYQRRACELSPMQHKMMEDMRKHWVSDKDGATITAANAAVKMVKLLQLASGACYDDTGETQLVDAPARLDAVKEIIEEADRKVIIWCPFKHSMNMLKRELALWHQKQMTNPAKDLADMMLGRSSTYVELINGDTSASERQRIITAFQQDDQEPKVLIAHPATAAHGLTLVSANVAIWYGPTFSAELTEQANARINRPGQKHHMTIIQLGSTALEWGAYDVATAKSDRQNKVLDMYRKVLNTPIDAET